MEKKNNNFILKIFICIFLSIISIIGLSFINRLLNEKSYYKYVIVDDSNLVNTIEGILITENNIILNGYAFMADRDSDGSSISIFLLNVDTKDEIWLDMDQINRSDVNSYFKGDYNYENSGFIAYTNAEKLKKDACYEIIVNIDYMVNDNKKLEKKIIRKTVSSKQFIINNKLYNYNPNEFNIPDFNVKSELLRDVFNDGKLCLYQKDYGMYVYQYKDKLYWIATKDFKSKVNEPIIYFLYTTQINKLPEDRVVHKMDNLSFSFDEYEYIEATIDHPYRVAVRDIPKEYAITYITTGIYSRTHERNIWSKNFQLKQVFK